MRCKQDRLRDRLTEFASGIIRAPGIGDLLRARIMTDSPGEGLLGQDGTALQPASPPVLPDETRKASHAGAQDQKGGRFGHRLAPIVGDAVDTGRVWKPFHGNRLENAATRP